MSAIVCIPCLNNNEFEFIIHAHSTGRCSICGKSAHRLRQTLRISITDAFQSDDKMDVGNSNVCSKCGYNWG